MKQFVALIVLLAAAMPSAARTWSVAQDGSGDWTTIQESFDAAASGDTILIAAGRYSELHMAPGYSDLPVVGYLSEAKDLTIIGAGREDVIIGPEAFVEESIALFFDGPMSISITGIQLVNSWEGIGVKGVAEVINCLFNQNHTGVSVVGGELSMTDCDLYPPALGSQPNSEKSILGLSAVSIEMARCKSTDLYLYLDGVSIAVIRDCVFEHPEVRNHGLSVNFVNSTGLVDGNITDGYLGCSGNSHLILRENEFQSGAMERNLDIRGQYALVEIYDNVFHGGSFSTLYLSSAPSLSGSGNHILNGGGHSVKLRGYGDYSNNPTVDLRNNYWGTDDPAQIDAWIYDIHDDPSEDTEVLYQPFSDVPLPTEKESLGGFRSMYR